MLFEFNGLGGSLGMPRGGSSGGKEEANSVSGSGGASSVTVSLDVGSVMSFDPKSNLHMVLVKDGRSGSGHLSCI